jgi:hypothetical protein
MLMACGDTEHEDAAKEALHRLQQRYNVRKGQSIANAMAADFRPYERKKVAFH